MDLQADILIVTATRVESIAVMSAFKTICHSGPEPKTIKNRVYHSLGLIEDASVFMVQSETGSIGPGGSVQTVQRGIEALSPKAVVMTGIAFGVDQNRQSIGDILVSKQIELYDLQRIGTTESGDIEIIPRGDRISASPGLLNRFRGAVLYWHESSQKVSFGRILCGEKLVDNIDFRDQLRKLYPETIGGEMEGAGLYVACQDAGVDWILVKSICDWADGKKGEDQEKRQLIAANNSALFVLHALRYANLKEEEKGGETPNEDSAANRKRIVRVELHLGREFPEFTSSDRTKLLFALSRILQVKEGDIEILKVMAGSVIVLLTMPYQSALKLLHLSEQKDSRLEEFNVTKVSIVYDFGAAATYKGCSEVPATQAADQESESVNMPVLHQNKAKKLIVFVEDRRESIVEFVAICKDNGFKVKIMSTPHYLADYLLREGDAISMVVVDTMLPGVEDLESIGIRGADTVGGYMAGWAIIEHLLRPPSRESAFMDIPILVLTARRLSAEDERRLFDVQERGGAWIAILEKHSVGIKGERRDSFLEALERVM